jgi:protein KTI12
MKVIVINEESLMLKRNEAYKDSTEEKNTRGLIKAAVDRNLSQNTIVICDSLNYIKGFRYQLYCTARAAGTPSCVVYCDFDPKVVKEWNAGKSSNAEEIHEIAETKWDSRLLDELVMRFETPNESRRWESPTFIVSNDHPIPFEAVTNYLLAKQAVSINLATQHTKISDTNYLHEIDKVTQEILKTIIQKQGETPVGSKIFVPNASKQIVFLKMLPMAELQRHRRTYLNLNRQLSSLASSNRDGFDYGDQTSEQIANSFVDYLNANWNN